MSDLLSKLMEGVWAKVRFIVVIPRFIKLCVLAMYMFGLSSRGFDYTENYLRFVGINWPRVIFYKDLYFLAKVTVLSFFNRHFIFNRCITVDYDPGPIGMVLDILVAMAWMCEKMKINIKIQGPLVRYISNTTLFDAANQSKCATDNLNENYQYVGIACFARYAISSEYGYKIISKLSIKDSLKQTADAWLTEHIAGNWVAVHYRGTDIEADKNRGCERRYRIELDNYIKYLKSVLDNQSSIFACSDQQQFIDKMRETFPNRVFARDIHRSYDSRALHLYKEYKGIQQQKDALVDMLILAKAELIYATGSSYVDAVRYFNPKIKIASIDGRKAGRGKNNIPIPRKDLLDKLSIPL